MMQLQGVDISKTSSASTIVFEALREAIIRGELKDGEPLRQEEIARRFNTSRIPVREAIARLEQLGLAKSRRYKGSVVAGISPEEVEEIFDFRELLECRVIEDAVARLDEAKLAEARTYCEAFFEAEDPMTWGGLNRDFHYTLYSASKLRYHLEAVTNALDRIDPFIRAQIALSDGMTRANDEHMAILEACEARDAARAKELTARHVSGAKQALLKFLPR